MNSNRKLITVSAGVIYLDEKILIGQRRFDKSLGGFWEFPGGKIEQGETRENALIREIKEEFDINIKIKRFLMEHVHQYESFDLKMYTYEGFFDGKQTIHFTQHEQYLFETVDNFDKYKFCPADMQVIEFLKKIIYNTL